MNEAVEWAYFALLLVLFVVKVIAEPLTGDRSIIGGHAAEHQPFFARVGYRLNPDGDTWSSMKWTGWHCGATIVAPNAVVTAAACLFRVYNAEFNASNVLVFVSNFTHQYAGLHPESIAKTVSSVSFHKKYNPNNAKTNGYNIALIKVNYNFNMDYYQKLEPCPFDRYYKYATAIGMNESARFIFRSGKNQEVLLEANMEQVPVSEYKYWKEWKHQGLVEYKNYRVDLKLNPGEIKYHENLDPDIMAIYRVPEQNSNCSIDWNGEKGGPLVYKEGNDVQCLLGMKHYVNSEEWGCHKPVVFTRVPYFADWIQFQIAKGELRNNASEAD